MIPTAAAGLEATHARAPHVSAPPLRRWILDLGATAAFLVVSIAGWWPTFAGPGYLVAAVGALVLGLAVAAVCAWRRWGILITAGLAVAAYFLFGPALAVPQSAAFGFVPTGEALGALAVGVVTSWKQLLTTIPPVAAADGFLIVPFLLTFVSAVLTASLALRLRRAAWALIPASVSLVVQIVMSMPEPAVPIVQGILFAATALGWLAVRQAWAPSDERVIVSGASPVSGGGGTRLVSGALVVVIAAGAGVAATLLAPPTQSRQVLRQIIVPPFDVRQYPSPLQSFRKQVRDDEKTALFTVTGLPKDARIRLATMDAYTGVVFNVASAATSASGAFTPLRTNMSQGETGTPATLRFTVGALTGVWLPDAGWVQNITFDGKDADALRRSGNYNEDSGTAVVTAGLTPGDRYTVQALIDSRPAAATLKKDVFAPITLPKPDDVPQSVVDKAATVVSKARTPYDQAQALADYLHKNGFFSHGLRGEVVSRAGHGAERISELTDADQMVGDDEQYAVTMALMARSLGMPARVVMGYYPGSAAAGRFTATGDDLHAWVEVDFQRSGWVSFDPTPSRDRIATAQKPKPKPKPKPQVPQPPPPVQQPADDSPSVQNDRGVDHKTNGFLALLGPILAIGGGTLGVVAILLAPFLVIGALKASRRRKRRDAENPADRISGGWDELVDRASDYGTRVPPGATRAEDAALLGASLADPAVAGLAVRADGQVFGPAEPSATEIEEFWRQVDEIVAGLGERASVWRRLRARLSLRAYLADTRLSQAVRQAARSVVDSARTAGAQAVRSVSGSDRDDVGRGPAHRADGPGTKTARGTHPDRGDARDDLKENGA